MMTNLGLRRFDRQCLRFENPWHAKSHQIQLNEPTGCILTERVSTGEATEQISQIFRVFPSIHKNQPNSGLQREIRKTQLKNSTCFHLWSPK
jgi:hypothetical protein